MSASSALLVPMVTRTNPSPGAPKSSPRPSATRPRSRSTWAGSGPSPSSVQSTQARKLASGGVYLAPGSRSPSSLPNSVLTRSSCASSASSQSPPELHAASEASTPNSPAPYWQEAGSWAGSRSPAAEPATATAPLRPATLNALDAEASVIPRSAAAPPSETYGVCRAPGRVSEAWISSATTSTPYCSASSPIRPRSAALNTRPVGLCGLQSR